jgi:hypothetical protein
VRYLALVVIAIVLLTGIVWWLVFFGNAVMSVLRRRG